ncbi:hypothetical protein [Paraburkholderia sp. C35]|uniref:hypothetical protein n=1 Tax=Paraburkholderia sp. C35 TaxID=2126993 RepID=UPI000D69CE66|nr:hypothetical protein [Paraburkholderia sp. C35]
MTTSEPIYVALKRLELADLDPSDREDLAPAFNALHGGQAIALPDHIVERIRALDAQLSTESS